MQGACWGKMSGDQTKIHKVELDISPLHLLHRASQCAVDVFQAEMTHEGLTPRQFAVLVTVSRNEGLSQTDLVSQTGIDRSTLADVVRRMLKKGLLQRRRTREDARAYAVTLTDEGKASLRHAMPHTKLVDEKILAALPVTNRERFIKDLQSIISVLTRTEVEV